MPPRLPRLEAARQKRIRPLQVLPGKSVPATAAQADQASPQAETSQSQGSGPLISRQPEQTPAAQPENAPQSATAGSKQNAGKAASPSQAAAEKDEGATVSGPVAGKAVGLPWASSLLKKRKQPQKSLVK